MHTEDEAKTMTPKRPRADNAMRLRAAEKVVAQLVRWRLLSEDELSGAAEDIARVSARHGMYADGYQLMRDLDRDGWEGSSQMVEELDSLSSHLSSELAEAEKTWAAENNIQPPHPVGTRGQTRHGEAGEITGVSEWGAAKYAVKLDKQKPEDTSRRIINFEDFEVGLAGRPEAS